MELGERLRVARTTAGMTQQRVADHFGIKRPTVTQWELGSHRPDSDKFTALANLFGVPLAWLMDESGPGPDKNGQKAQAPIAAKFLRSSKRKYYVREWRTYMMGDKVDAAAKAAGLPLDEYQAFETYPINFTLGQLEAVADEIGIQGHQFWFPPPKERSAPLGLKMPRNIRLTVKKAKS
jgi:transcriptional regulator with XRE-family HTH domain